ncbi:MAG TPA: hypothetical protein VGQ57_16690 [Polyangiaceae bacterium]|nr:hypothetical protein [Polyangiaceae bacterium]
MAFRAALSLVAAALVPGLYTGCQSLANIEERELGQCGEFCDTVMQNCKDDNQVYERREKCMGWCEKLDVGDPTEPQKTNTLACRLREAQLAGKAADENISDHCRSAGPEGVNCGGACLSYCTMYERACGGVQCSTQANCQAKCQGLRDNHEFNLVTDYEGNSLQCRLVHLTNATIQPEPHCGHAALSTPTDHCNDLPEKDTEGNDVPNSGGVDTPTCADYCRTNLAACTDANQQYESQKQCEALCPYFDLGAIADKDENTMGCRLYHSYNSLCDSANHCPHSGPGGEGHCGTVEDGKCEAYCTLSRGVCPSAFATKYKGDSDKCTEDCKTLTDYQAAQYADPMPPTRYNITYAQTPGTLACRFLQLSKAAQDGKDGAICQSLSPFGEGACAP